MAKTTAEAEIWIVVDESGDYVVGKTEEDAFEAFENDIGGSGPRRSICLTATVPLPVPLRVRTTIPAPKESEILVEVA